MTDVQPDQLTAQINALPEMLRCYIMELETRADPAGDIRELVMLRDRVAQLEAALQELRADLAQVKPIAASTFVLRAQHRSYRREFLGE
jgi:hypothetical protein